MKKYARLFSAIALILAIITCLSGCSLAELTRSIISKENEISSNDSSPEGSTTLPQGTNDGATNAINVGVQQGTTAPSQGKQESTTQKNTPKPTQKPTQNKNDSTTTTKKNYGTGVTETPVKDIQDYLWDSKNPNDAQKILKIAGFEYDDKQGIYYSQMNPLQRKFGFNFVYDTAAPIVGMIYDTERLEFVYDGKEWMIQLWKGQYGITSGAEVGLYSRDPERVMQYDCADDSELIVMQYDFYNMGEYVFSRGPEKHWWLTGFKVFNAGIPFMITMDITLKFTDNQMASAFLTALKKAQKSTNALMNPINYKRNGTTIRIIWGSVPDGIEVKDGKIIGDKK